jgi:hypothetical protein
VQRIKKKVGYVSFMGTEHRTIAQHEKLNRLEALNPDERMGGGGGGGGLAGYILKNVGLSLILFKLIAAISPNNLDIHISENSWLL